MFGLLATAGRGIMMAGRWLLTPTGMIASGGVLGAATLLSGDSGPDYITSNDATTKVTRSPIWNYFVIASTVVGFAASAYYIYTEIRK
ncbi:MAG: hypothetical protein AAFW82_03235 [Pseudomonadota bacterium]